MSLVTANSGRHPGLILSSHVKPKRKLSAIHQGAGWIFLRSRREIPSSQGCEWALIWKNVSQGLFNAFEHFTLPSCHPSTLHRLWNTSSARRESTEFHLAWVMPSPKRMWTSVTMTACRSVSWERRLPTYHRLVGGARNIVLGGWIQGDAASLVAALL